MSPILWLIKFQSCRSCSVPEKGICQGAAGEKALTASLLARPFLSARLHTLLPGPDPGHYPGSLPHAPAGPGSRGSGQTEVSGLPTTGPLTQSSPEAPEPTEPCRPWLGPGQGWKPGRLGSGPCSGSQVGLHPAGETEAPGNRARAGPLCPMGSKQAVTWESVHLA